MRKIYLAVAIFFLGSILIFIASFIYLDKTKHKIYYYVVNLDGRDIGTVKVDRFETEDKIIYRSSSNTPFSPLFTESKSRITLKKDYDLESYGRDRTEKDYTESIYIEKGQMNSISFVSRFGPDFICLDNMPVKKDVFMFEEGSIGTYMPLIENYNFRKGKSQGFNALTFFSISLPPVKRFVTLTSIKDEYLRIDNRKIKTENLILKIRNYPQGAIWIAKSDKSIAKVEIPGAGLKITRTFSLPPLEAKNYILTNEAYTEEEITLKSKGSQVTGILTTPKAEGKKPAILLIWGAGPQNRDYQGLFSSMADFFAKNGFCVLRLDKRGVGSSSGSNSSFTLNDEMDDLNTAFEYLAGRKEVDPGKILALAHAEGAQYALKLTAERNAVRMLILMAPAIRMETGGQATIEALKNMASKAKWSDDYLRTAVMCNQETEKKAATSNRGALNILGKKVFLENTRQRLAYNPADFIKKIKVPVLILQGKETEEGFVESASLIDNALREYGNQDHVLRYYGYAGTFFAKSVNDGIHRIHYEADKEILIDIRDWIKPRLTEPVLQADTAALK